MYTIYLKSVHDLGQVLSTDEASTEEEAISMAEGMINEVDRSTVFFENYEQGNHIKVDGYDNDDNQSMYYVTIEETDDLDLDELQSWFYDEIDEDYDPMDDVLDNDWDNF